MNTKTKKQEKLTAEMWDKMQYLFRNFYDRMIHGVFYYDKELDINALKQVLVYMTERAEILHSSFHEGAINPYWTVEDYTIDDILTVETVTNLEASIDKFITGHIPVESNVQYRVAVFNSKDKTALCILLNHMCMDGGDFKYFIKKLSENYNRIIEKTGGLNIKHGNRSYEEVYSKLSIEDKIAAKKLYKNISAVKDEHKFPLTPDSPEDKITINKCKISKERFLAFKAIGKKMNVTINDLMLTFYIRSLYEFGNFNPSDSLAIPCMVDLRRHIVDNAANTGLTNHTGFMVCNIKRLGNTINDTLNEVLSALKHNKTDKFLGLYSLPLLNLAYTIFPFHISEFAIKIGYLNPLIGMSNIGLLNAAELQLGDATLVDAWVTGGVKYKPYMQLALTTLNNEITMTIAIRGNEEDKKIVNNFFDVLISNVDKFIEQNKHLIEE